MERRWSGRLSNKIGMGFEIQYHPAGAGAANEFVNDAFIEYYRLMLAPFGQASSSNPFGFDIQQSSSAREAPERRVFADIFPGPTRSRADGSCEAGPFRRSLCTGTPAHDMLRHILKAIHVAGKNNILF